MARKTAAQALARWQSGTAGAGQYYQQGIQNATNWAENATAAGPARDAGLQQAIASGTIDAGIRRLGTAGWKSKTLAKGPAAWQSGVSNGGAAYSAGYAKLSSMLDAGDQAVASIPRGGFAQNMQRAVAYATAVHQTAQTLKQQG